MCTYMYGMYTQPPNYIVGVHLPPHSKDCGTLPIFGRQECMYAPKNKACAYSLEGYFGRTVFETVRTENAQKGSFVFLIRPGHACYK